MFKMHQHPVRRSACRKTVRRPKTRRRPGFLVLAQGLLLELLCLFALLAAMGATGRSNQFLDSESSRMPPDRDSYTATGDQDYSRHQYRELR